PTDTVPLLGCDRAREKNTDVLAVPWTTMLSATMTAGGPLTVATEIVELFVGFGSDSFAVTLAKFVIEPRRFAVTITFKVVVAPPVMLPKAQITLPLVNVQVPCVVLAER